MKKVFLLFFLTALMSNWTMAQGVQIEESSNIDEMMTFFERKNREKTEISAWRIQVLATTDRRMMEQTKSRFARTFPYLKTRWTHKDPYYQIKAGAFATKIEALPELDKVKRKFRKAHLVRDFIPYSEIVN